MISSISCSYYIDCITRRTPCLIYYEDKNNVMNEKAIYNVEKLRDIYKLVLCYKFDWKLGNNFYKLDHKYSSNDVLCFREFSILCCVSAFSYKDLDNLFRTIYNDCVINFCGSFAKILRKERRINGFFRHKEYKIENLAYNIYRGKINNKNLNIDNCLFSNYPPKMLENGSCVQNIYPFIKNIPNNPESRGIVPVTQGLPSIKIFFVPLNEIPTSKYFVKSKPPIRVQKYLVGNRYAIRKPNPKKRPKSEKIYQYK